MENDQAPQFCPICFLSCKKASFIFLGCGCSACSYCLSTWILNKITTFHYNIGDYIPCITLGCRRFFSIDEVRPYFNRAMLNRIDNALLQVYLNKAVDVRRCPGQKCSYAGTVTPDTTCKENLECTLCKTQWSDHQPQDSKKSEIFTTLWKWIHTKKCPRCKISIQKNGGCPHMVCSKCLCQFCWYCMLDNDSHFGPKHIFYEIITPLIFIIPFMIGIAYLLVSFYNVPAVKAFADATITPAVLIVINGIRWVFLTFWKLGVASLFDLALRILLFSRPLIIERKAVCVMIMACCIAVTCYYGAYQGVFYALMIETTVVSLIKWLAYVKKMKRWERQQINKKLN